MSREFLRSDELELETPGSGPAPPVTTTDFTSLGTGQLSAQNLLALQRSAGNSAVNGLLRSAVVQRCAGPAGACGCELCAGAASQQAHSQQAPLTRAQADEKEEEEEEEEEEEQEESEPDQGVHGQAGDVEVGAIAEGAVLESPGGTEDEEAEAEAEEEQLQGSGGRANGTNPAQRRVRRAIALKARKRRVARTATWTAGPVHKVNNLADCVINNKAVGVTWPYLNGTQFWSAAEAIAAINKPTCTIAAAGAGFEAEVTTVPTNTGSFDETVLAKGPWRLDTTMAAVTASGVALPAACNVGGNTRFRAYGNPSDGDMFSANRRHEDHHANDHKKAFNTTIKPWDTKLKAALKKKKKFPGATAADAEAALWAAMGGTPDDVATAFYDKCQAAVNKYHGSAKGGPVGAPTKPGARNTCPISWAKYKNPS